MTLFLPPDIKTGIIEVENGRFILKGDPTEEDTRIFEKWREATEKEERKLYEAAFGDL